MSNTNNNPDAFVWTDELVNEWSDHVRVIFNERNNYCGKWDSYDTDFKKWKEKKQAPIEERFKVTLLEPVQRMTGVSKIDPYYDLKTNRFIPKEKYESIKLCIERELNGDKDCIAPTLERNENFGMFMPKTAATNPDGSLKQAKPTFEKALQGLINSYSIENRSDTPDYILAQYLSNCLIAYENAKQSTDNWFEGKSKSTQQKDSIEDKPTPKLMWNKEAGIHNENCLCMAKGCQEYSPLNAEHEIK